MVRRGDTHEERREFQRLQILEPIDGWFGDHRVRLIDISAKGARVEYDDPLPVDSHAVLRFISRGETIEVEASTIRIDDHHSGLFFVELTGALRDFISRSATEILKARVANVLGDPHQKLMSGGHSLDEIAPGRQKWGLVTFTLGESGWTQIAATTPDQPPNGFTISSIEPESDVELLRRTYEAGDAESRRLTRLLAELSVAAARRAPSS
jgi:hypothetical protein